MTHEVADICVRPIEVDRLGAVQALLLSVLRRIAAENQVSGLMLSDVVALTGLTSSQIASARRDLMNYGVLEYQNRIYAINDDRLKEILATSESPIDDQDIVQPKKRLLSVFLDEVNGSLPDNARKLSVPDSTAAGALWWGPLGYIVGELCDSDVEEAIKLVRRAVRLMRDRNLTIKSPKSIVKVAETEIREMRNERWAQLSSRRVEESAGWTPL